MNIDSDIKFLKGVGEKRAEFLTKLGIRTPGDLITFFPRAYEDMSNIVTIAQGAMTGDSVCVKAFTGVVRTALIRKGMTLYKLEASDGENVMDITYFNNPAIPHLIKQGHDYLFFGKIENFRFHYQMNSPKFIEYDENAVHLSPVYRQTAGLNSRTISKLVSSALENVTLDDCLTEEIIKENNLISYADAIKNMHFPESEEMLEKAKRRLSFEELLVLQIGLLRLKEKSRKSSSHIIQKDFTAEFAALLPFELTGAQRRVIGECTADMSCGTPMNRLVQGDVGSGKTAVAAAAVYNCVKNGFQCAMMAPTEVLAQQHYKSFEKFFEETDVKFALITGSTPASSKKKIKAALAQGELDFIIGTHALISKDVEFSNLGLAITDEQHRFGVNQRDALSSKGKNPHILVMSATPIPRTLSLIIYGDLDLSIIDEMPAGRRKIDTFLIDEGIRERAYGYVKKHLLEGRQGYIVCPLVEDDDDNDDTVAAKELYKKLSNGYFKGFKVGLLYGKMKAAEKKEVMDSFSSGETQLLISTTVIEVGVDVPNAVIMVIENADRFGLSQLHQLRGRIGRGKYKSSCILITDSKDDDTLKRLKIISSTSDGFKIADEDLKLRGPGDFFGSRQHGLPDIKTSRFMADGEIIRETNVCAAKLLKTNPELSGDEYALLRKKTNEMFSRGTMLN